MKRISAFIILLNIMARGDVVEPDERTTEIRNIPAFKIGFWNGDWYGPRHLREMTENFRRFGYYKPHGSVNHDDWFAAGKVRNVHTDGVHLFVDLGGVKESIAKRWNSGELHGPSIELWDTERDPIAREKCGFYLPDGHAPGMILKSVSLCGNQPLGVKSLPEMPKATYEFNSFSDLCPASKRFTQEDFGMDKATMISRIKAADPKYTDDFLNMLSDQQIASLMDIIAGGSAAAAVDTATPGMPAAGSGGAPMPGAGAGTDGAGPNATDPTAQMSDESMAKMMKDCGGDPKKFLDACAALGTKMVRDAGTALARINRTEAMQREIHARTFNDHATLTRQRVRKFMDETAVNRIPPAMRKDIEELLIAQDAVAVRKFSDGSKAGTALEEKMADILQRYPVDPRFERKFTDEANKAATRTVAPGGKPGGTGPGLSPRALRMMQGSELGKTILRGAKPATDAAAA